MPAEIERKFLVKNDRWRSLAVREQRIAQGYLANTDRGSVRVRLMGDRAFLSVKSMTLGVTRSEFEYPIPADDARYILQNLCLRPIIEKTRYYIEQDPHLWEIDVFEGENAGLIVAEIELNHADEEFTKPDWLGAEVSDDPRYYNVKLMEHPYSQW
jgi:adenylate cyclase